MDCEKALTHVAPIAMKNTTHFNTELPIYEVASYHKTVEIVNWDGLISINFFIFRGDIKRQRLNLSIWRDNHRFF
jgi:hypothetical protein